MKQINKLVVLAAFAIAATSCNKAAERTAELDKKIASNVVAVADINEITADSKAQTKVLYVSSKQADVDKLESGLKQIVIADKADMIIKKVVNDDTKKVLDTHLKTGAVAFAIVKNDDGNMVIKVMRVVPDVVISNAYDGADIVSLTYVRALKQLSTETDIKTQSALKVNLSAWKYKDPKDWGEKFGLVEITQIKITKMGVIENMRTEYGEKKSILGLTEKPMGQATHFLIGDEVVAEEASAEAADTK